MFYWEIDRFDLEESPQKVELTGFDTWFKEVTGRTGERCSINMTLSDDGLLIEIDTAVPVNIKLTH